MAPANGIQDRTGVFVDAGWVLAAAAMQVLGTPYRDELTCDYRLLVADLAEYVERHSGGAPILRTYWYDAAPGGTPTYEHDRIAAFPYVTVRLGRLNRERQQKGVDVLIYRDLMTLARERAIGRAYLVAGDEDLRVGVEEAKEFGVQVVLLGMPIEEGHNQSARLVRECDDYVVLPREVWEPHFSRRNPDDAQPDAGEVALARRLGDAFAREWARKSSRDDALSLLESFPTLPQELDIQLLVYAEEELGSLRRRPDLKSEIRGTFWAALKEETRGDPNESGRGSR
jgi:uncharacterized LabA/DUF88 family protein